MTKPRADDRVLFWTLLVTLIAAIANTIELVRRLP